ncbi:hypothetical protein [Photobacterium leiognathi]|uniref:hypothetical protein n=1 Tax=Photobacterium leiognathi TaxID=553611 RepID=UPI00273A1BAF|nr:hypothetical protein [Photobacterium leiognathi]
MKTQKAAKFCDIAGILFLIVLSMPNITDIPAVIPPRIAPMIPDVELSISSYASLLSLDTVKQKKKYQK